MNVHDDRRLDDLALDCLKRGTTYESLPSVRAQAVESLQYAAPDRGLPWIRNALQDEHPGVRFAACMALGTLRDATARTALQQRLDDPDRNVQLGAIFALHRLQVTEYTHRLPEYLFDPGDTALRANAALVLGRLGEPGGVKLLAKLLVSEKEEGVRLQALESLALLGNEEALKELTLMVHSEGDRGGFVLGALGELKNPKFADLFRQFLTTAHHLETRLIAARSLGRLGSDEGLAVAMEGLRFAEPKENLAADPAWNQVNRVRQLAALALGAIGESTALQVLEKQMTGPNDPRIQLAAARAILEITAAQE